MKFQSIFKEVKSRIDSAIKKKDYQLFDVSDLGFKKEKINDGRLIHELHVFEKENETIEVDFRCYDPSGAFQNIPDINKFTVEYKIESVIIDEYQISYND